MSDQKRNISAGTVARFIILLLALVNAGLNMAGVQTIPVDEAEVELFVNMAWLGGASLWAYWKNNDVTRKSRGKE